MANPDLTFHATASPAPSPTVSSPTPTATAGSIFFSVPPGTLTYDSHSEWTTMFKDIAVADFERGREAVGVAQATRQTSRLTPRLDRHAARSTRTQIFQVLRQPEGPGEIDPDYRLLASRQTRS
jgi:hypothetical protein